MRIEPSRPVRAEDYDSWPVRWKLEGFNSCWRRGYDVLESLAAGTSDVQGNARVMAQIAYEMKLTQRVLEQRFRKEGNTLNGESFLQSLERRLFTMSTQTKGDIAAVQVFAQWVIDDVDMVDQIAQSERGQAFLRTVHCLATDIDGPGFEMWNDYERLVEASRAEDADRSHGADWRDHWPSTCPADTAWGGAAGVFRRETLARALRAHFNEGAEAPIDADASQLPTPS